MSGCTQARPRLGVSIESDLRSPRPTRRAWRAAAARGETWTPFQEMHWLRCWWDVYGRGELIVASAPGVLEAILESALARAPGLLGFRFYHVPDASTTGRRLREAAARMGFDCVDEGRLAAPVLDLGPGGEAGLSAAQKKSLVRHERGFRRLGTLTVRDLRHADEIVPRLEGFFDQHERRWRSTGHPSLFRDPRHRAFYRRLATGGDDEGWLRFTSVEFDARPIAFHLGFSHRGTYYWYKPSFEIDLARESPGEVLLRQLLLAAVGENARIFDFGLGDEAFKHRFASRVPQVRTWGLYPAR